MNHYEPKEQDTPQNEVKAVWDAVNAYHAHLNYHDEREFKYMVVTDAHGIVMCHDKNHGKQYVCTIKEFNQCVKDMSEGEVAAYYAPYCAHPKELLTKENSDYSYYEGKFGTTTDELVDRIRKNLQKADELYRQAKELEKMNIKQPSKLRLDYFLSLELKLVEGDVYFDPIKKADETVRALFVEDHNTPWDGDDERFITSLAPRKNTGEQPCGGDVPVICNGDKQIMLALKWLAPDGSGNLLYTTWTPDIEALIKMQDENDAKQAFIDELVTVENPYLSSNPKEVAEQKYKDAQNAAKKHEDQSSKNLLEAVLNAELDNNKTYVDAFEIDNSIKLVEKLLKEKRKQEQPKYTEAIKLSHGKPLLGMLAKVKINCPIFGEVVIYTVTYLSETDKEICCIGEDDLHLIVDKEEFMEWLVVDGRSDIDIANEQQVSSIAAWLIVEFEVEVLKANEIAKKMQDDELLAEWCFIKPIVIT